MPEDRPYRLSGETVEADRAAMTAMQKLHDYAPVNPAYRVEVLTTIEQRLVQARENEIFAKNALAAARDETTAAEWALHDAILGVKAQVLAQYGPNSDAVASMGLKKKSKWRRASARSQERPTPTPSE